MTPEQDAAFRAAADGASTWSDPGSGALSLSAFPVEALPRDVGSWVRAISEEAQTPVDLAAMAALSVLGAAGMGRAIIDCGRWDEESCGLYLICAVPSGERKSAILREATKPLRTIERERAKEGEPVIRELRSDREVLDQRKRRLTKEAGHEQNATKRRKAEAELKAVDEKLDDLGEAVPYRLLADDATPEALGHLLAQHGSIAIVAAESALLDNLSGRYSDGAPNLHVVCNAYAGEPTVIDRRGRDPERLDRPLLSVGLMVQPHVLASLIGNKTARAQGLVARFAYSMPTTAIGERDVDAPRAPAGVHDAWAACVRRLAGADKTDTKAGSVSSVSAPEAVRITLTDDAAAQLREVRVDQERRLGDAGDLRPVADWAARHPGRVVRIAGLLHLAEHPITTPINGAVMANAICIGDYLLDHGLAALTGPDEETRKAAHWLERRGEATVSERDLQRGPKGSRGTAQEASDLAASLVWCGVLRPALDTPPRKPGRPPSATYEVHPKFSGAMARTEQAEISPRADLSGASSTQSETAAVFPPEQDAAAAASLNGTRECACEQPIPGDEGRCQKCGRELP
jgi:hypothetical protein